MSTARLARKIRFEIDELSIEAEGDLDRRGRRGTADVPVHFSEVRVWVRIKTRESEKKLNRLIDLVGRFCPVDSLFRAAVSRYQVIWERVE